jgi:hypothetical protein
MEIFQIELEFDVSNPFMSFDRPEVATNIRNKGEKLITQKEYEEERQLGHTNRPDLPKLPYLPPEGTTVFLKVETVHFAERFYVHLVHDENSRPFEYDSEKLDALIVRMNRADVVRAYKPLTSIQPDVFVIAKYKVDQKFYRARIINSGKNTVLVSKNI